MKISVVILAGSLVINAALLALLVTGTASSPSSPATTSKSEATVATKRDAAAPKIDAEIWPDLIAGDLPALVAQLREAGFPIATIRAILSARMMEAFQAKRREFDPEADTRPFWKTSVPDPKIRAAELKLSREWQKTMRDLLGDDAESNEPMSQLFQNRRFGGVPSEKLGAVKKLLQDYDDRRQEIYGGGTMLPADQAKLAALEKEQHDAVAQLLTPQELADYDLRSSNTANSLRSRLATFDPTEQEFLTLFALQKSFDDRFGPMHAPPSPEEQRARSEAQKSLTEQFKTALGPDRYAEFERASNYEYRQTNLLVGRLELPATATNQVWAVQKEFQPRIEAINTDKSLSAADRTAQLSTLAAEAQTKVTAVLGPRGYDAYKQYGGSWLQALAPRPASVVPRN